MRKTLLGLTAAMAMTTSAAQGLENVDLSAVKLEGVVELPIKNLRAVQNDGQIFFVSDNGRFVLTGQLYDIWYKTPLDSLAQMEEVAARIDFTRMGMNVDTLNTVSMGSGEKQVVVFVDPLCTPCHALMHDARKLTSQYTFKFIAVPALGEESNRLAKTMACAKDPQEALDALLNNTLKTLPTRTPCDVGHYDKTLLTAQLLGIEGVPFIVGPEGRVGRGRPANLAAWLEGAQ